MEIKKSLREKAIEFLTRVDKRIAGVLVALVVLLGAGVIYLFVQAAAVPIPGTTVKISKGDKKLYFGLNGNDKYTYRYTVKYTAGTDNQGQTGQSYEAVCAETDKNTPHGLTSAVYDVEQEISATKVEQIKRILLTTYIGRNYKYNGVDAYSANVYDWSYYSKYANGAGKANTSVALGHVLISYIYSGSTTGFSSSFASNYWAGNGGIIQQIYNKFESDATLKSLAESVVVRRSEGGSEKQDLIWLEGVKDEPEGELGVRKSSSDEEVTNGNSYYQLKDAVFEVYNDEDCSGETIESDETGELIIETGTCTGTPVATLTTGANGQTGTVSLPVGTYWVKEKTQPQGYRLNTDIYATTVIDGDTVWLDILDDPIVGGVKIKKIDSETLGISPQGGASLSGTKFGIYDLTRLETVTENLQIGSDGTAEYSGLAPGTYKIKEFSAGTGYILNNGAEASFTIGTNLSEETSIVDLTGSAFTNQVIRGDFKFVKYARQFGGGTTTMAGIPFLITANYGGGAEKHVVVSDANGVVDTSKNRCTHTNANDSLVNMSASQLASVNSSSLDSGAGVWFGGGSCYGGASGALPYGTYTVRELKISDNDAYSAINFTVTISSNGVVVDSGNKTNEFEDSPVLKTVATGLDGSSKKIDIGTSITIVDKVNYSGLTAGASYTLNATLVDKNGNVVSGAVGTTTFTAASGGSGSASVNLTVNTANYVGETLTVYEEIYRKGVKIGEHKDLNDSDQTVTVKNPGITSTTATGSDGSSKTIRVGVETIVDRVTLNGLVNGTTYKLRTSVKTKSGTALKLLSGTSEVDYIEASHTHNGTTGGSATVTATIKLDTTKYQLTDLVVYQELFDGSGKSLGVHPDNSSSSSEIAAETVSVGRINLATVAYNADGSEGNSDEIAVTASAGIRDRVHMTGLVAGTTYVLSGKVVDVETDNVLATSSVTKTMENVSGLDEGEAFWYMDFAVNTLKYAGKKLVVYEYLSREGTDLAKHEDKTDTSQIITVKEVGIETNAENADISGSKEVGVGTVNIKDTVTYWGLVEGDDYTLSAQLVQKDTGAVVAEATQKFKAGEAATVTFNNVNTKSLAGEKLVVYETLYKGTSVGSSDNKIAEHKSLEDTKQTITVQTPEIGTVAWNTNKKGGADEKKLDVSGSESISDTITYSGLVSGETYRFTACIYDGESKEQITQSLSKEGFAYWDCAEVDKTVESGSGTVDVLVGLIDAFKLIGKKIVVKETVSYEGAKIAEHDVLKDGTASSEVEKQTVTVKTPEVGTTATDKYDNDTSLAVGTVKINDLVTYSGLKEGDSYILTAKLVDKNGNEISEKYSGVEYTVGNGAFVAASGGTGEVTIEISLDDTAKLRAAGVDQVTIYEYLAKDGTEIAKHEEIGGSQTLEIQEPKIETDAVSGTLVEGNGDKVVGLNEKAKIIDTVKYSGLSVGTSYKITGKLYDQTTGEPLLIHGEEVTATKEFTAGTEDGEVELVFELDTTEIPGKDIVTFEKLLSKDEIEITKHEDIDDVRQWVEVQPRVGTKVVDIIDGDQAVGVGVVTVRDTVKFEGVRVGEKYRLYGVLMDKETGKALEIDEEVVEGETIFTPETSDGEAEVEFTFNSTGVQGKGLVVFEELYQITKEETEEEEGEEILRTEHKDLEDKDQWIDVKTARIGTTAVDSKDGDKELDISNNEKITDIVEYYGLVKGQNYKLVGELMNKETGESLKVQRELEFVAEGESGEVNLEFGIDTSELSGKEVVVFETLYFLDKTEDDEGEVETEEIEIAEHKDLDDQKQSVWVKVMTPNTGMFGSVSDGAAVGRVVSVAAIIGALGAVYAVVSRKRKIRF